jgi:upstream activation factor subunit UAF30
MALPLSVEEQQRYSDIIDDILDKADLTTISRKVIVRELETRIGKDTSEHKVAVKELIVSRFDAAAEAAPSSKRSASEQATDDGTLTGEEEQDDDDDDDVQTPPKKRQKRDSPIDADAKLAAQLQAQEDSRARSRSTRGSGSRASTTKDTKKKKAPARRKKSAAKVGSGEDSGVEGGGEEKKKRAGGGFQKPFKLSPELSAVCGGEEQVCVFWRAREMPRATMADNEFFNSSRAPRLSRSFGSTSRATTCRTPRTSGRSSATRRSRACLAKRPTRLP